MIRIHALRTTLFLSVCMLSISIYASHTFVKQVITKGDLIFDGGAYVGLETDFYLSLGARVVAIEPQKIIASILEKRFGDNQNVKVVAKGLASQKGFLNLYVCHYFKALSSCSVHWIEKCRYGKKYHAAWPYSTPIEVVTLDDLIQEFGVPKLCKLDIENYEYEALCGLSTPIKYLVIEFHVETIEKLELCISRLKTLGNYVFNFSFGSSQMPVLNQCVDAEHIMKTIQEYAQAKGIADTYCGELYASL